MLPGASIPLNPISVRRRFAAKRLIHLPGRGTNQAPDPQLRAEIIAQRSPMSESGGQNFYGQNEASLFLIRPL